MLEMVGRENVYFLVFEENRFVLDAMDVFEDDDGIGRGVHENGLARNALRLKA